MPLRPAARGHMCAPFSFSAPKGVERACPRRGVVRMGPAARQVSVPRRALRGHAPTCKKNLICPAGRVSVPRRALRGHAPDRDTGQPARRASCFSAPKGVERACPSTARGRASGTFGVSVPRRALRGHAPGGPVMPKLTNSQVSVPRRALRGHAPPNICFRFCKPISFSAPKGVERACPIPASIHIRHSYSRFSAPKGVERACPSHVEAVEAVEPVFQCPEER